MKNMATAIRSLGATSSHSSQELGSPPWSKPSSGLGSNLGEREVTLRAAIGRLRGLPDVEVIQVSSFRDTEPVGYVDQPRFLNGAVELETGLTARALLGALLELERAFGRDRSAGPLHGPRTLDLDLLLYGAETIDEPLLNVPHPRLHERRFVLEPLAELDPDLEVPGQGPVQALLARLDSRSMSHLDELDEFEAELELQLKREYTAVFGLFRYCVLTQDATYLCNKLDLAQVSQPNYPFFHLKMEDVWVWDKNRPTRIIPRAEVWTSSDVTVEELRAEGDEPSLTAEALAEKIGESSRLTTTSSRSCS